MNSIYSNIIPNASLEEINSLLSISPLSSELKKIIDKVLRFERISVDDGIVLFSADLSLLALLADYINQRKNKNQVYYNKNIHIEPTNYCVYNCRFCSYSRPISSKDGWILSLKDIEYHLKKYIEADITEVHMVGGVHPEWGLGHYKKMIEVIKTILPHVIVKAYTAVEIAYISKKAGLDIYNTLNELKESGLSAMPGGGAEIFNDKIRKKLCPDKCTADEWLEVHKTAHELNIPTNATILYGHIETYEDRLMHLSALRDLQDTTGGFNAFIPLKYRIKNNILNIENEVSVVEDLRNYAMSRIFLDNFDHIKAYWPMIGRHTAQLSLSFGVDDLDGTIDDSTKIYTLAGAEEQKPVMTSEEIIRIINESGKIATERDTFYNILKIRK